ncbi:MAG: hypothetical protein EAZ55_11595 [Cytophagales bacterium]|nr:MAG: hypothetical protein EAZ55_11595 [Cytophagales bacterium]
MKKNLLILLCAFTWTACGGNQSHNHEKKEAKKIDSTSKEYASMYVCPMHCEGSGSEKPGKCPVCEMDYVENKKTKKAK